MPRWCRRLPDGTLILRIHAQPGARRTEVAGQHGDSLKIRLAAPAVDDRANDALVGFVAERLGVPRRGVVLVSGARSREKRLRIEDYSGDIGGTLT